MEMKYWIEAADPKHRYGSLLVPYYKKWLESASNKSFYSWLDKGDGATLDLQESPRQQLMESHVEYLDKESRKDWEVVFRKDDNGQVRLFYNKSGEAVSTPRKSCFCIYRFGMSTKYIFVVDGRYHLYIHP